MSLKFQALVQYRDDVGFVKLSGVIDEDNELTDLTDSIPGGTVVIELGEIERINSCGVRDWVNWLTSLEAKGADIVLVDCSPAIVAQINLVNNFTGQGTVKSFYVPYFCPECDEEKVFLSETSEMGPPPHVPPVCRCDGCDLVMDFDDMPDSYFAFLLSQKKVSKPDKVRSVLEEFGSAMNLSSLVQRRPGSGHVSQSISHTSLPSVPTLPTISGIGTGVGASADNLPPQDHGAPGQDLVSAPGDKALTPANNGQSKPWLVYGLVGFLLCATGVLGYLVLTQ